MKILLQTPDFKARPELESFINEKLEKLSRFDEILEVRLLLKVEKSDTRENKIVEMKAVIPGNDIFVTKEGSDFESSILEAIEVIKRQIIKRKEQL